LYNRPVSPSLGEREVATMKLLVFRLVLAGAALLTMSSIVFASKIIGNG
jgi:hypothetical protein